MHPVLVNIFGLSIAWYGVLITIGVLVGAVLAQRLAARRGLNVDLLGDMIFWTVLWGVVGARVFYILTSPDEFRGASFLQLINIRQGGISIHGGVVFGVLVILYYQLRYRINFYRYADTMLYGLALGIIGGRIGNFFNGTDTMGRLTGWPIGYTWPNPGAPILGIFKSPDNWTGFPGLCYNPPQDTKIEPAAFFCQGGQFLRGPVHLTQIYGVLIGVVLVVCTYYWLKSKRPGWAMWNFVLWYSVLRSVFEETFRLNPLWWKVYLNEGPHAPGIGLFTATQLFSVPIILVAAYMLWRIRNQPVPADLPAPDPAPNLVPNAQRGGRGR
ncbi:MAG TPA: prolipoprotein diacylglyceryl transferase [Deinococcales bacterium]|nr:prolipoprotein diacylglyceryl transferase [Deinococcales bacterium]